MPISVMRAGASGALPVPIHRSDDADTVAQPDAARTAPGSSPQARGISFWTLDLRTSLITGSMLFNEPSDQHQSTVFDRNKLQHVIHPDDCNCWRAEFDQAVVSGTDYEAELRVRLPDADFAWRHVRAQIIRDAGGAASRMIGVTLDVTQRRLADLRLELSEESLRLATDAAEVGTWDLDLDTDILTWSNRTKAMFGISSDRPCSMADFYAGLHPDDLEATKAAFASSLDPELRSIYDVEYRTIGKEDGIVRWVAAKGKGLFEAGRCRRALGTAIDITARKYAAVQQTFLLDLWDRLHAHTQPNEILDVTAKALGTHLGVNRVGFGHVQPEASTIEFETCYDRDVAPIRGIVELRALGAHNLARQRAGQTVVHNDVTSASLNEPEFWAETDARSFVSVPLVRDGELRAILFVGSRVVRVWPPEDVALIEDVARRTWDALQRARAEAALREANGTLKCLLAEHTAALRANEARLRTIFETSFQLQGLLAPDGTLLEANATSLAAIECQLDDVVGKPFWETPWFTGTPRMSAMAHAAVQAAMRGESVRQEIMVQLPSGMRSYDFSLRPIRDEVGAVVAIVPEAVDITERRQAEDALRQAQKMEAIGQLTGGIAHDFNNLLTAIMGSLELVNQRIAAGRAAETGRFVAAAMTAAQRAAALTQRLLAFARRQPLVPEKVDGNRLIAGMEDLLRRTLGPGIDLNMRLTDELWPIRCDPNQLENAILNLAINARDAMPGGGRLTLATTNATLDHTYARSQAGEVRPGRYVSFAVTDTGTGMEPNVVARAFEPFFTTKPTGQGTGLGLSMLYGFVKQSEGHVRIDSLLNHGTTITLYLPQFDGAADRPPDADTTITTTTPRTKTGEAVLVVDDETTVLMLVSKKLAELGYAVVEAADGNTALRLLQSNIPIDLLITDVGLPGLNGRQLADAARVTRPRLQVLFMTGYSKSATSGGGALEPGMDVIAKPFALDTLLAKVRTMTGNR